MNKVQIDYNYYKKAVNWLAKQIKDKGRSYDAIYPIPRGGYFTAIQLSELLGIRIECDIRKITPNTLVVNDICDSGKTIESFKNYDTAVAFVKVRSSDIRPDNKVTFYGSIVPDRDYLILPDEHEVTVEDNIVRILKYIGEDPNREGLKGTPDRIIRMWKEIFRGYDPSQKPKITTFDNGKDGYRL